jgi:type I restriction enzyme M protein
VDQAQHNAIVNFIWGIADDVLRDVYVRGKYRDVILPMTVIRRLDSLLEPTKQAVLDSKARFDALGITNQEAPLRQASGQAFYNTSPFTLRSLMNAPSQLRQNFTAYLDGFSPNVQEILEKFEFRNQIPHLHQSDSLGHLIEKFLNPAINLSPRPVLDAHENVRLPGLDNHGMGTIFEELIRRFNEENNEEAGEHFTPRDVVHLMANLIFLPIAEEIDSGTYLVYDGACGTGGMLTVAEETLSALAREHGKEVSIHLYEQEVNAETFAITKADLLLKGEGDEAENMAFGSTLSADASPSREFDFMLSNPPYGKSWKKDLDLIGGKADMRDPRFVVEHAGDPEMSLVTRTSDGQMMFLVNKLHKMKRNSKLSSRIAEVHNGSALFTGDAGQGESNIRRWVIENDWLEAIIALPLNIFYNTGIATYVWILTNRKAAHRRGKVQLIDATGWYQPLRRNLGQRNREMTAENIRQVCDTLLAFEETEQSKIFPNEAFGYRKVTVERPLRLKTVLTQENVDRLRQSGQDAALADAMQKLLHRAGDHAEYLRYSQIPISLDPAIVKGRWTAKQEKIYREYFCVRDPEGEPVVKQYLGERLTNPHGVESWDVDDLPADQRLSGVGIWCPPVPFGAIAENPFPGLATFEPDPDLRDTEQIPLLEPGGVQGFIEREVWPHVPDAWVAEGSGKIGYEISFTRYFYKPVPMRSLEEIRADILALEEETEGLLEEILVGTVR